MEYIPGYTTLFSLASYSIPSKVYTYFYPNKPNQYELFSQQEPKNSSLLSGLSSVPINSVDERKIPRWSAEKSYAKDDKVKHNGFLYTSLKESSNVNPVKGITDDFITVNSAYWVANGLSSNVKQFNPDTDASNVYRVNEIVSFDTVMYQCTSPGTGCTSDYTNSNVWTKLSSEYIPEPPAPASLSYYDRMVNSINGIVNEFTLEEIPGESLTGTAWRVYYLMYPYLVEILIFILAVVFASFSANDLLHKEAPYRILAFMYTYFFVRSKGIIAYLIFFYYLFRSFFGSWYEMNPLKIYGLLPLWKDFNYNEQSMFPTLSTYPASLDEYIRQGKEIFNHARLQSHGDITGMLAHALRVRKTLSASPVPAPASVPAPAQAQPKVDPPV
jgi:hypothetical protein